MDPFQVILEGKEYLQPATFACISALFSLFITLRLLPPRGEGSDNE